MNKIFLHNYHSHTSRCGHAYGEDEEYVRAAIEAGFKTLGFSDHVMLPGIIQERMRGDYSLLDDYIESVQRLKKKYEGIIDIKLGFECEHYGEPFSSFYKELLEKRGFQYLILGQHCYFDHSEQRMHWYTDKGSRLDAVEHYAKDLIAGMESGLYTYVAHPDLFMIFYRRWDENCERIAHAICSKAAECRIPLELNMGRSRGEYHPLLWDLDAFSYPYPKFWEIARTYPIDVIVGVDAHRPEDYQTSDYETFAEILRNLGMNWIQKLDI